jgi:hypothetical protein
MRSKKEIESFIRCKNCHTENLRNHIAIGRTNDGILIWCTYHDIEIAFFPFIWEDNMKCESEGWKNGK